MYLTPSNFFSRILRSEALVYKSYFFSEQLFYGNYSKLVSHTNTVISHAFAYSSRWRRKPWQGLLIVQSTKFILAFKYLKEFFFLPQLFTHNERTVFSFKLFKRYFDCFSFLLVRTDLYGGKQFLRHDIGPNMTYLALWRPPAVQEALDSENEFGYRIYEICICFRGVLRAHNQ